MAECSQCGDEVSMPFRCKFCEQHFCGNHRLPENHDCDGLREYQRQSRDEGKIGYDIDAEDEHADAVDRIRSPSLTERIDIAVPDRIPTSTTNLILGIVFLLFLIQLVIPGFTDLFALKPDAVLAGEIWRIVTAMFLHAGIAHLLVNAIVLFQFGNAAERIVGTGTYLKMLFAAGIASFLGFTAQGIIMDIGPALGISGALFGIVTFIAIIRPKTEVLVYFIIPLKIRTAVAAFAVIDIVNLTAQLIGVPGPYALLGIQIASAGHLAGVAVGLYYGYKLKDRFQPRQQFGLSMNRFTPR